MLIGTVFLMLFLTCVKTAPEPRQTKVTLIRDSLLGYNFDAGNKKASGTLDGTRTIDIDLPDEAADKAPELTLLENVNSGAGIALGANVDLDAIIAAKDKFLAGKFTFWRKR
ncbi:uncharacterized protein LOC111353530 [Spodoptera litura]|uniref:Uncharacterized protein LOC111353530 n=1 Tax=Spodoptera litura TaxID=69820 RepID=A0A9J7IRF8_SPOLT|nr:uncharacterized protein LOC111353530 [Spodoptera litura]